MTRPRKQTVDWFPHSCTPHGKTLFILEQRYGIAGYAFWFKILELLGASEGHFYNFNNPADRAYLLAYTHYAHIDEAEEVLDLLASLDAIDSEAWESKIIWSANFIKGIAQTYVNRRSEPPSRPDNYIVKYKPGGITTCSLQEVIPEGKGREGKGREEKDSLSSTDGPVDGSDPVSEEPEGSNGKTKQTPKFTLNDLAAIWNEKAPPELARVNLPLKRKENKLKRLQVSLKRNPTKEFWLKLIEKIHYSSFLRGRSETGWKASFDFFVDRSNEIDDGMYIDSGTKGKAGQRTATNLQNAWEFVNDS